MTSTVAPFSPARSDRALSRAGLSALFLIFCYALLSWRATLLSDAAPLVSERRILILTIGAGLFWLALRRLDANERISLARVASWIVGGTVVILSARVMLDWIAPAVHQSLGYDLRWSLAWGGYFGMWVMGAITFRRRQVSRTAIRHAAVAITAPRLPFTAAPHVDDIAWLAEMLAIETATLARDARGDLARRIVDQAGRYHLADERDPLSAAHNRRLEMAERMAERLRAD